MGFLDRLRQEPTGVRRAPKRAAVAKEPVAIDYKHFRDACRATRGDSTNMAFVSEDPRRMYLLPNAARNVYFLPYLLIGEMIETDDRTGLEFLSGTGINFKDEFDRQEYIARFLQRSGEQKRALPRRTFYSEIRIPTPNFDFESGSFAFGFNGYLSDKNLAYQVRNFQFIWEMDLRGFELSFNLSFDEPETAKRWKRVGNFLRIGLAYEVLGYIPRMWTNGMPATICFVRGFQLVSGIESEAIDDPPSEIVGMAGERTDGMDRDQIQARIGKMAGEGWNPI